MATHKTEKDYGEPNKSPTELTIRIIDQRTDVDQFDQIFKERHTIWGKRTGSGIFCARW